MNDFSIVMLMFYQKKYIKNQEERDYLWSEMNTSINERITGLRV